MELIKQTRITKVNKRFAIEKGYPHVTIEATYENSKLKDTRPIINTKSKLPYDVKRNHLHPMFVTGEFFKAIKKNNPFWEVWDKDKKKHVWMFSEHGIDLKDVVSGKVTVGKKDLIFLYSNSHLLFDHNLEILTVPHGYSYIDSLNSNEYLDLEKALPHLQKHPWVVNREELVITDVPYYNNESGKKKYIRGESFDGIIIRPDQKSFMEIYQNAINMKRPGSYWSIDLKNLLFGAPYHFKDEQKDYMKMKQFIINKTHQY